MPRRDESKFTNAFIPSERTGERPEVGRNRDANRSARNRNRTTI